jgi:hypothetical protein
MQSAEVDPKLSATPARIRLEPVRLRLNGIIISRNRISACSGDGQHPSDWKTMIFSADTNKKGPPASFAGTPFILMAERQGFEPWEQENPFNGFRDRPDQPLWHLSELS